MWILKQDMFAKILAKFCLQWYIHIHIPGCLVRLPYTLGFLWKEGTWGNFFNFIVERMPPRRSVSMGLSCGIWKNLQVRSVPLWRFCRFVLCSVVTHSQGFKGKFSESPEQNQDSNWVKSYNFLMSREGYDFWMRKRNIMLFNNELPSFK